jgi:hypothetical protein
MHAPHNLCTLSMQIRSTMQLSKHTKHASLPKELCKAKRALIGWKMRQCCSSSVFIDKRVQFVLVRRRMPGNRMAHQDSGSSLYFAHGRTSKASTQSQTFANTWKIRAKHHGICEVEVFPWRASTYFGALNNY